MHFHNSLFFFFSFLTYNFYLFIFSESHSIVKHVPTLSACLDLPFLPKLSFHKLIIHVKGSFVFGITLSSIWCVIAFAVMTNSGSNYLFSFESNAIHSLDRTYFDQSMKRDWTKLRVLTAHNQIVHKLYLATWNSH